MNLSESVQNLTVRLDNTARNVSLLEAATALLSGEVSEAIATVDGVAANVSDIQNSSAALGRIVSEEDITARAARELSLGIAANVSDLQNSTSVLGRDVAVATASVRGVASNVSHLQNSTAVIAGDGSSVTYSVHAIAANVSMLQSLTASLHDDVNTASSAAFGVKVVVRDLEDRINITSGNVSALTNAVAKAARELEPLENVNREDVVNVFNDSDTRFVGPDGLQKAYDYVISHVLVRQVTLLVADGNHTVIGSLVLRNTPYGTFVRVQGASNNATKCRLRFPRGQPGVDVETRGVTIAGIALIGNGADVDRDWTNTCLRGVQLGSLNGSVSCENWYYATYFGGNTFASFTSLALRSVSLLVVQSKAQLYVDSLHLSHISECHFYVLWAGFVSIRSASSPDGSTCTLGKCCELGVFIADAGSATTLTNETQQCPISTC